MRKIHYCDDFVLEFCRRDGNGNVVSLPSHDWRAVLHTASNYRYQHWTVESRGGEMSGNATVSDDGRMLVFALDRHGLDAGRLIVEWYEDIPEANFKDGYRHIHRTYKTDIELVRGQGDDITEVDIEVVMPYIIPSLSAYATKEELERSLADLERSLVDMETMVSDDRILPFDRIVYTLDSVESPYEGLIVFVESLGVFRKYTHDTWGFDTEVSPYNLSQHGITVVNSTRLFRLSGTGSLYRKSLTGNRLESVAWSDDTVTHDQLTEQTDSIYETIADLRQEVANGIVLQSIDETTIDEMM